MAGDQRLIDGMIWVPVRGFNVHDRAAFKRIGLCGKLDKVYNLLSALDRDALEGTQGFVLAYGLNRLVFSTTTDNPTHRYNEWRFSPSRHVLEGVLTEPHFAIGIYNVNSAHETVRTYSRKGSNNVL